MSLISVAVFKNLQEILCLCVAQFFLFNMIVAS